MKPGVTGFGSDLNTSLVLLHNSLHSVQTESRPLSNSLGGEERFKDVRFYLGGNSGAVVANLHYHASILAISSHSKLALSAHRVDGIVDDVGPDLIELAAKRIDEEGNALVIARHHITMRDPHPRISSFIGQLEANDDPCP